jgi:hypothetical protein
MAEFFQAFEPLFEGFCERAQKVEALLKDARTRFLLVAGREKGGERQRDDER